MKIKGKIDLTLITWAVFATILYYIYSGAVMSAWLSVGAGKILATIITWLTFIGPAGLVNLVFWSGLYVVVTVVYSVCLFIVQLFSNHID